VSWERDSACGADCRSAIGPLRTAESDRFRDILFGDGHARRTIKAFFVSTEDGSS